ncbi:MAG TPA: glucose 1-dehydrogenase [Steroidobacter sp.]
MNELFDLSGRVALVTGAGRGLGAAAAAALARAGATVVISDIDGAAAQAQLPRLHAGKHTAVRLDVCDDQSRRTAVQQIVERHGRLDILVNNAGIVLRKAATATTSEEFAHVLDVNVVSMLALSSLAAPLMAAQGAGRIINLSSIVGLLGRSGVTTYAASKAAIAGLTRSLAAEFGPAGINVNAIAPGYLLTEMNASNSSDTEFYDSVIARTPLRRWGTPEDIAGIIVFLAAPASAFITGQTILLDGGIGVTLPGPRKVADDLASMR